MPKDEVDYWVDFFKTCISCEEKLDNPRNRYNTEDVDKILADEMPEFDIDVY